jgi:hypothetical protein
MMISAFLSLSVFGNAPYPPIYGDVKVCLELFRFFCPCIIYATHKPRIQPHIFYCPTPNSLVSCLHVTRLIKSTHHLPYLHPLPKATVSLLIAQSELCRLYISLTLSPHGSQVTYLAISLTSASVFYVALLNILPPQDTQYN